MESIGQRIIKGDCLEELKGIEENSVDSIVTDPPYELGFMGKKWDSTGIAYNVELWRECLRVLKPGGHLLAFSGTRTYHRMAVAIEDAGFEIRDMIEWVYGSGFPKSLAIGKAVDKLQGNERESEMVKGKIFTGSNNNIDGEAGEYEVTKGTSEWEGWGTALKPSHEPICMARKPLSEKNVAENCLKWGTGGINIDGSRVGFQDESDYAESTGKNQHSKYKNSVVKNPAKNGIYSPDLREPEDYNPTLGRFPANLIHDGSEEVKACFPENASRFFKSIIYQAKASKAERNAGCDDIGGNKHSTVKPVALMEYLINMVTPPSGVVLDPFGGSGTTAVASVKLKRHFILIEREPEYIEIIKARVNKANQDSELTLF